LAGVVGAEEDISCWVAIRIGVQRECCVDEDYAEKSELHRVRRKESILEKETKRERERERERERGGGRKRGRKDVNTSPLLI
jgi:hypothetical protein